MLKNICILLFLLGTVLYGRAQKTTLKDSVFSYICHKKIQHPNIVMRQAILETGWFKSPYLMEKNNLFGFRNQHYLSFKSWKACIDYYKEWQTKRYKNHKEDYYHFLIRIKYAAKGYIKNLKRVRFTKECD